MIGIDREEKFGILTIKKPHIVLEDLLDYIKDNNLELSYSIFRDGTNIDNYQNQIYAMRSIGKVFYGIFDYVIAP
jgi:hypothetical protein